jgi:GNAT superfamily N-acetyltransferase
MHTFKEKLFLVEDAISVQVQKNNQNEVIIEENWIQVTTPNAPVAHLNGILKCSLESQEAEERIVKAIEHYEKLGLPFQIKISPSSKPKNLSSILVKHKMQPSETLYGLYADPNVIQIPNNPNVEIKLLDLSTLEDWLSVQASAWGTPSQGIEYLRKQIKEAIEANTKKGLSFIAYLDNRPVASAGVRIFDNYALLAGAAVNPDLRGKGIYRSLLAYRLEIIKRENLPAIIHCLESTSAPICLKLGFEKICEIHGYESINSN